jgi:hypothetical protein
MQERYAHSSWSTCRRGSPFRFWCVPSRSMLASVSHWPSSTTSPPEPTPVERFGIFSWDFWLLFILVPGWLSGSVRPHYTLMTYDWFKSPFKAADLDKKSVAFSVPLEQGGIASGEGTLEAVQDGRGYIRAAINHGSMTPEGAIMAHKVFIPVEAASKLVKNPPGSKCEFSFIAA